MEKLKSYTVTVKATCEKVEKEWICTDDYTEYELPYKLVYYHQHDQERLSVHCIIKSSICVDKSTTTCPRTQAPVQSLLYEDTEFTDFQLRGTDGAVAVHKCVMAIHSDVFKKMMTGEWKEAAEGSINLAELTVRSLQHLKDYMYMGTLPDEDDAFEMLLLIADCYMIDNLKASCIKKLVKTVTSANVDKLIEFACQNTMPDLVRALLYEFPNRIQNGFYPLEAEIE